jgi:putative transposase
LAVEDRFAEGIFGLARAVRKDYLHKLSDDLSKNHTVVVIED